MRSFGAGWEWGSPHLTQNVFATMMIWMPLGILSSTRVTLVGAGSSLHGAGASWCFY